MPTVLTRLPVVTESKGNKWGYSEKCEAIRNFWEKRREYLKGKINDFYF
jgi:hypothetical protein